jgi:hypothetical protein
MPDESYRDLYEELAMLRQEMAEARAERDAATARWQCLVDELSIHDEWEPFIEPPERRVAAYIRNANREAEAQRAKQAHLFASRARLIQAATRVVQLVTHGADSLVVGEAIAAMRRVLDGGGE